MHYHVRTSGGIANLSIQGSIDESELPHDLADRVAALFDGRLPIESSAAAAPQMCDGMVIEVTATGGSVPATVHVDQTRAPSETWSVCNDLLSRVIAMLRRS